MHNFKNRIILFIALFIPALSINAQRDGTRTTNTFINEIRNNLIEEEKLETDTSFIDYYANLSITVYSVSDSSGETINPARITNSVKLLNSFFSLIKVKFYVSEVKTVNEYGYSYLLKEQDTTELIKRYSTKNTINLYLVDSIHMDDEPVYGSTFYPNEPYKNYIFLDKQFVEINYLVTLMGHFFGLLSTHENSGGTELVNGENCKSAGDFLCDTYADPNIYNMVDTLCIYMGGPVDGNGDDYVPSVANFMSESADKCKCIFTPFQYRRMLYYLINYRGYLR